MPRASVGVMSATRRSALPESSAGISPSQSKSRKVILTPISLAISSASSTELPVRSPLAPTSEKGGPCVCTATRSSPRLVMSSSVPALAARGDARERKSGDEKSWQSSFGIPPCCRCCSRFPLGCFLSGGAVAGGGHRSKILLLRSQVTVSVTLMPRLASSSKKRPSGTCSSGLSRPGVRDLAPRQHLRHDAGGIADAEAHAEQAGGQVALDDQVRRHRLAAAAFEAGKDIAHHAQVLLVRRHIAIAGRAAGREIRAG